MVSLFQVFERRSQPLKEDGVVWLVVCYSGSSFSRPIHFDTLREYVIIIYSESRALLFSMVSKKNTLRGSSLVSCSRCFIGRRGLLHCGGLVTPRIIPPWRAVVESSNRNSSSGTRSRIRFFYANDIAVRHLHVELESTWRRFHGMHSRNRLAGRPSSGKAFSAAHSHSTTTVWSRVLDICLWTIRGSHGHIGYDGESGYRLQYPHQVWGAVAILSTAVRQRYQTSHGPLCAFVASRFDDTTLYSTSAGRRYYGDAWLD